MQLKKQLINSEVIGFFKGVQRLRLNLFSLNKLIKEIIKWQHFQATNQELQEQLDNYVKTLLKYKTLKDMTSAYAKTAKIAF